MTATDNIYLLGLERLADEIKETEVKLAEARSKRANLMWEARRTGASYQAIANACGVTKAYVHQVVTAELKRQGAVPDES